MPRHINSSQRRHKFADKVFSFYFFAMRLCAACRRTDTMCLVFDESDSCEQYLYYNRFCDLVFLAYEWKRLRRAKKRLSQQISKKRRIAFKTDAAVIRFQR
jgi:hypothetical protein